MRISDWSSDVCSSDLSVMAEASSPSSSSTAMTWLTGTPSVPSATRIFPILPSSTASTSMVALSVSISAMTSPELISSPSFTSHLASVPSVMVGDSAGIRMLIGICVSPPPASVAVADFFGADDDIVDLRQRQGLQVGGIGHRHVDAADPLHRRVEPEIGRAHV